MPYATRFIALDTKESLSADYSSDVYFPKCDYVTQCWQS